MLLLICAKDMASTNLHFGLIPYLYYLLTSIPSLPVRPELLEKRFGWFGKNDLAKYDLSLAKYTYMCNTHMCPGK